jgi:hypothetical protein
MPDHFPGAACPRWDASTTATGGVLVISLDAIQHSLQSRLPSKRWCHLATDGPLSELHQMVARLERCCSWFQNTSGYSHDDLTPVKRAASHLARRAGGQHTGAGAALLSADARSWMAPSGKGGSTMMMLTQEFVRAPRLQRPLSPGKPPSRLGSRGRRCPSASCVIPDCFPGISQVFPDSICYNQWQIHTSVSASARWCGLPWQFLDRRQVIE